MDDERWTFRRCVIAVRGKETRRQLAIIAEDRALEVVPHHDPSVALVGFRSRGLLPRIAPSKKHRVLRLAAVNNLDTNQA